MNMSGLKEKMVCKNITDQKSFLNKLTPLSKEFYDEYEVNSSDISWKNKKFVFFLIKNVA